MNIKKYLYHTKNERIAAYFLLSASLIFFFAPKIYSNFFFEKGSMDFSLYKDKILAFEDKLIQIDSTQKAKYEHNKSYADKKPYTANTVSYKAKNYEQSKQNITYTDFDPNTVDENTLAQMGLKPNTIKSIINYRSKGGKFRIKADLKKIYTLKEDDFSNLEKYILLPDTLPKKANFEERNMPQALATTALAPNSLSPKKLHIEINTADAEEFQKLYGIGPAWSKKIVNFREKLGGYKNVEQLAEIYNFPDSTYKKILPFVYCDSTKIKCLSLNNATYEELSAHPYISSYQARSILKWRENIGQYERVDFIFTIPELDDKNKTAQKIFPYLCL